MIFLSLLLGIFWFGVTLGLVIAIMVGENERME